MRIDIEHPILTWLREHSMCVLNRLEVANDGKTADEMCEDEKAQTLGF